MHRPPLGAHGTVPAQGGRRVTAPQQPQPEQQVEVGPIPVTTAVGVAQTPAGGLVLAQFLTPQGMNAFFLSPEHARSLAGQLTEHAAQAATGLILPTLNAEAVRRDLNGNGSK
jgi:hypothetical protein